MRAVWKAAVANASSQDDSRGQVLLTSTGRATAFLHGMPSAKCLGGTNEGRKAMLDVTSYVLTVYGYVPREVWLAYLAKRG